MCSTVRIIPGSTGYWHKNQVFWHKNQGLDGKPGKRGTSQKRGRIDKDNIANKTVAYCGVDEDDPWSGFFSVAALAICLTKNRLRDYSLGQLVFGHDMILLIKHTVDWELIC